MVRVGSVRKRPMCSSANGMPPLAASSTATEIESVGHTKYCQPSVLLLVVVVLAGRVGAEIE